MPYVLSSPPILAPISKLPQAVFLDLSLTDGLSTFSQLLAGLRRNGCSFLGALKQSVRTRALSVVSLSVSSRSSHRREAVRKLDGRRRILRPDDKINEKNSSSVGFLSYGDACLPL